ncbi:MAG: 3D domain-containing protein [Ruminococcus sp.]
MAIREKQLSASKVIAVICAIAVLWVSVFSVSAQTISEENSKNTETEVSEITEEFVLPNGDTLVSNDNATIDIVEAVTVKIKDGTSDYKEYDVPQGTVKKALAHANIKLGVNDTVNKNLKTEVEENSKIKVNRISYVKETKTKKVAFKTVKKETSKLYVGQKKVQQKGKKGTKKVTYTSKVVNGKVKDTIVSNTKVTKKAKKKIVLVGTKRKNYVQFANNPTSFKTKSSGGAGTIIDCNGKKIAYKKIVSGSGTAYYAHPGARTSVGDTVHVGGVAVNPNVIPYGSKLYIESPDGSFVYGYAVANDTGGFATAGTAVVDLYYDTLSQCVQFGRRTLNIYVLA